MLFLEMFQHGIIYFLFLIKHKQHYLTAVKLYVNGVLQTFGTTTYTQNQGYHFFRPNKTHYINQVQLLVLL